MPTDIVLRVTLISTNYPCLEHIFMPRSKGVRAIEVLLYMARVFSIH